MIEHAKRQNINNIIGNLKHEGKRDKYIYIYIYIETHDACVGTQMSDHEVQPLSKPYFYQLIFNQLQTASRE